MFKQIIRNHIQRKQFVFSEKMSTPKFPVKFKPKLLDKEGNAVLDEDGKEQPIPARGDIDPVKHLDDLISQWDDF